MKVSFVVLFVLLCLLQKPIVEGKTVASGYRNIFKTVSTIREEGFHYTNIPKILVNAAPILQNLYDLWHVLLRQPDLSVVDALFRSKQHEIIGRIITISDQVSKLDSKVNAIADTTVKSILEALPRIIKLETNLHDLQLIINQINFSHDQLRSYLILGYKNVTNEKNETKYSEMTSVTTSKLMQNGLKFGSLVGEMSNDVMKRDADPNWLLEKFTLLDFAVWATGHGFNSLKSLIRRMNDMVLSEVKGAGILDLVRDVLETKSESVLTFGKLRSRPPDLSLIDNIRVVTFNTFDHLWRNLKELNDVNVKPMSDMELLHKFENIDKHIKKAENFVIKSDNYLFASDWIFAIVDGELTNIDTFYETFVRFQKENLYETRKPQIAWEDLAETYLQKSDFGVIKSIEKIHRYIFTTTESENLFKKLLKETQNGICNMRQSPQQTLYNLYNTIAVAELKAHTVLQFSYMLLKMYNKGNFTVEADLARSTYEQAWKRKINVARETMSDAGRTFYKCDPKQYVEGVTYTKLTKLIQGYIENEVNLNPYGTCRENCQYYEYTEYNGCFKSKFCAHQPQCRGKVTECRFVDSDMNICTSTNPERRYDWIEYENGKILGNKGVCQQKNLFKVDSWWRYLFWHCSYCLCFCDDTSPDSDRFFNLRDVTSDIEKNMIVTGVRIVKQNQIIHFQIQQGVLTPFGVVNKTSLSWKPVDNYTIDDDDVQNEVDYFTMTWLKRALDTDEVFGPPEHVVTGLRFRKLGFHLNLEVRVTPINFTTGEVFKADHSYWLGNDNTGVNPKNPRTEILLTNPDIPIRNGPHSLNSKHDQYIQFQATSFDTDAGQTTVPFLDSQDLTAQGYPLSGIGLIHRGKQNSGGFIAPKIISYDFTPHLLYEKST